MFDGFGSIDHCEDALSVSFQRIRSLAVDEAHVPDGHHLTLPGHLVGIEIHDDML